MMGCSQINYLCVKFYEDMTFLIKTFQDKYYADDLIPLPFFPYGSKANSTYAH